MDCEYETKQLSVHAWMKDFLLDAHSRKERHKSHCACDMDQEGNPCKGVHQLDSKTIFGNKIRVGLAQISLDWLGLAWLGLAWIGWDCLGLAWLGLAWIGLD